MVVLDTIVLSAIVVGIVQAVKTAFKVESNWLPLLDIALALAIGGSAGFFFGFTDLTILDSLVAGLMAGGLWDVATKTIPAKTTTPQ